jgi:hypothetical protein
MRLAALLSAFIAISTAQVDAIRVQFPQGTSSTTIKETFGAKTNVRYLVHAAAGQRMKVGLMAPGANYRFFVYAPKSDEPLNSPGYSFDWSGELPVTGDYLIQVFTDSSSDRSIPFQLSIAVMSASNSAHPAEANTDDKFSPDGYYVFTGKSPRGFENFKGFSLTTAVANPDGKAVPVPPSGTIDAGGKYKMVNIKVSHGALSFESSSFRGASYKFEGKFLVSKGYCDDNRTTGPVLSGHLSRFLNGARVADAEVKFEWSCSDI